MQKNLNLFMVPLILVLVTIGYFPSLIEDFVPQDQWRAFTYGLDIDGVSKWAACVNSRFDFFILTGRPLVWIPECIEHGLINHVGDFKFTRLIALGVVLVTMLIFGFAFRALTDSYWKGVYLSVPIVMAPGYAFMFFQGLTAGGVLAAVAFSAASVYFATSLLGREYGRKKNITYLVAAAVFFMLALFNYAAFAFVLFPSVFFIIFYSENKTLRYRVLSFLTLFAFYILVCFLYLFATKYFARLIPSQDLGQYQISFANFTTVTQKAISVLLALFENGLIINIYTVPYLGVLALIGATIFLPLQHNHKNIWQSLLVSITFVFAFPVVALIGSGPVIVSLFEGTPTRHVFPGAFMVGFAAFIFLMRLIELYFKKSRTALAVPFLLVLVLVFFVIQQYRITNDLVNDSNIEINAMRIVAKYLVEEGNWAEGKHIHIVRPLPGSFSQKFTWFNSGEYAPATTQNPAHAKEMITMALREQLNHNELSQIYFRDCRLILECGSSPPRPFELVVTQSNGKLPDVPWSHPYKAVDIEPLVRQRY